MRVFSASLATETNTFGPMPTSLASFRDRGYYKPGEHPDHPTLFTGPLWAARLRGEAAGWTLIEGTSAGAQPSGITTRHAYETLREEILADLRAAMPVDIALLGLHGAMVERVIDLPIVANGSIPKRRNSTAGSCRTCPKGNGGFPADAVAGGFR
jgi:microcystin degradation protein MlrC